MATELREPPVYASELEMEQTCQGEDDQLVTFGFVRDDMHYADGAAAESHFAFNKALWEAAGKPDKLVVAFSINDDFLAKTLPGEVNMEQIAKNISDAEDAERHYYAVFPELGIEVFVGKAGWIKGLKERAGEV